MTKYRNYVISYDTKPIPLRAFDYDFQHEDCDGAPDAGDHRYGQAASMEDAKAVIDEQFEDLELDDEGHYP